MFLILGVALLYWGAEGLVRGSSSVARRMGLSSLVIGLTVVAAATGMPELIVSLNAAFAGKSALAVGNVVGSNIGNIALILSLAALVKPPMVHAQVIRLDLPILIGLSSVLFLILGDDVVSRWEGAALVLALAFYFFLCLRVAGKETPEVQSQYEEAVPKPTQSPWRDGLLILGGFAFLGVGAELLVRGAVVVVEAFGLSDAVIGLTVVAIGTSLPELATSLVAAHRNESDIAVGNVMGSNIFNIGGVLGLASVIRPMTATGIGWVDLGVMLVLTVVLLPLLRTGFVFSRWEGALLLACYAGYVTYLLKG